jgi:hypothetical protein
MKEEGAVSEKPTGNDLDHAARPNMVRHHSAFRSQMQLWRCKTAHGQYNSSDSGLQREISGEAHRQT